MKPSAVFLTGASSGIGRATAIAFAREGTSVVVAGRRETEGNETVRTIEQAGGEAIFVAADIRSEASIAHLVERAFGWKGRLDFAFNNAGTEGHGRFVTEETEQNFDDVFGTNVKGTMLAMKHEFNQRMSSGDLPARDGKKRASCPRRSRRRIPRSPS
jgi:NAD(P)-dependent dehydrogenase (short-subunit alcohol dehydrogenase family)